MARVAWLLSASLLLAAACSGTERTTRPGFRECAAAWNAADNHARQALVANVLAPQGYTRTGIQLSLTSGHFGEADPNPIGCRFVFYDRHRWVAYLAHRSGRGFRFSTRLPVGRQSDQRGVWPKAATPGPQNAKIIAGGKLTLLKERDTDR
jgi:hypothetical protein